MSLKIEMPPAAARRVDDRGVTFGVMRKVR
jgi:hypothetical protein